MVDLENLDDLARMNSLKTPGGIYMCNFCGKSRNDFSAMKAHMEAMHFPSYSGYTCDLCNKLCKTKHALNCHKSRYHKNWDWYLTICVLWNKHFSGVMVDLENLDDLARMNSLKTPGGIYMCNFCGKSRNDFSAMKAHMEAMHFPSYSGYTCDLCNKLCKTKHALYCHKSRYHRNWNINVLEILNFRPIWGEDCFKAIWKSGWSLWERFAEDWSWPDPVSLLWQSFSVLVPRSPSCGGQTCGDTGICLWSLQSVL